jgi:hypothetical protein
MELNTLQNIKTSQNVYSANADAVTDSPAASNATSNSDTDFGGLLAQAMGNAAGKTLNPEVQAATTPSTTIVTSSYVFDPLCVVGHIPESNTFLQAILAMLGKPLEATQTKTPQTISPETAPDFTTGLGSPLPNFALLPTVVTQAVEIEVPPPFSSTNADTPVVTKSPPATDLMSSIEAQLSYQTADTLVGQFGAYLGFPDTANLESLLTAANDKEV